MPGRVYAGQPFKHYDAPIHHEHIDAPNCNEREPLKPCAEGKVSTMSETTRAAGLEKNIDSAIKAVKKLQEDIKALGVNPNLSDLSRRKANLSLELLAAEVQEAQESFIKAPQ
jgi:hypothetical protein